MTTKTMPDSPLPAGPTLWQIGDDLEALEALLAEVGGDVSEEEAEAAIDAWLAETRETEAAKLDRYGALIRTLEARAEIQEKEAARLMERAQVNRNAVKRLKDRLLMHLERTGRTKADGHLYSFTVAKNGGKPPLVIDEGIDPMTLPVQYRRASMVLLCPTDETLDALRDQCSRLEVEPDTAAIRAALDAGEFLPFARIGERGRHLRIR